MATTNTTNASVEMLRKQAKELRDFAKVTSNGADNFRSQAADLDRQAADATKRADDYEAAATTLSN